MAREIIQMYDKYHSTKKVFPKVIEECLPEDYQGLPEAIEEIPTVVANPELAGTEADLEGLLVGDTKYKVGGGKQLYQHNIQLYRTAGGTIYSSNLIITNGSPTEFTLSTLIQWLKDKEYTGVKLKNVIGGYHYNGSQWYFPTSIYVNQSDQIVYYTFTGTSQTYGTDVNNTMNVQDQVDPL